MEYLRVAQDLDMYGIQYYPIYNQKDTNLLLGVSAQGIGIYETHNRMSPRPFFPWSEIKNIYFKNKQFTICVVDKSKIKFRAQEMSINMSILDLCIGTHNLYLRRRQPDSLEVQQMKVQAKEQRQKRANEQARLVKERERRLQAEGERERYKNEVAFLSEQIATMQEIIRSSDESHRITAEKLEQEKQMFSNRTNEAEAEIQRIKYSQMQQYGPPYSADPTPPNLMLNKTPPPILHNYQQQQFSSRQQSPDVLITSHHPAHPMQFHKETSLSAANLQDSENLFTTAAAATTTTNVILNREPHNQMAIISTTATTMGTPSRPPNVNFAPPNSMSIMSNGNNPAPMYSNAMSSAAPMQPESNDQMHADQNGNPIILHTERPQNGIYSTAEQTNANFPNEASMQQRNGYYEHDDVGEGLDAENHPMPNFSSQYFDSELQTICDELEKARSENNERNRDLRESLVKFREEIDHLKMQETEYDKIHANNVQFGIDKYSVLRRSGAGPPRQRVDAFDQI